METESPPASSSRRPRTWLLVLLGVVVLAAVFALNRGNSADPTTPASNPSRPPQRASAEKLDPEQLDVKLERLKETPPVPDNTDRNPFRFQPRPPPPAPEPPPGEREPKPFQKVGPEEPPPPIIPPPPPIPLKFIGVTEAPKVGKIAALTDCRRTVQGVEGEIIEGRYRIVKVGVESLVIEYADGRGRTTLRMSGQDCVAR